jgi:hypothetical protein
MAETRLDIRAHNSDAPTRAPTLASRMCTLAETYPELGTFTPDATLAEIKTRYGLGSLEQVRGLGRRRLQRR